MAPAAPALEHEHRLFVTGITRSGKSSLARALTLASKTRRLIIDPADDVSGVTSIAGEVVFSDPLRRLNSRGEDWHAAAWARFVPTDPFDLEVYDALYRWAFHAGPRMIWCDEAGMVMPARRASPAVRRYLVQGAKRGLGHIACHTRPREVDPNLLALSAHLVVFDLPNPADVAHVAQACGLPAGELQAELRRLEPHGFVWVDRAAKTMFVNPPLRSRSTASRR
jgi:hypothetical protein